MTDITSLATISDLKKSDQLIVYQTQNGKLRKTSLNDFLNFVKNNGFADDDTDTPPIVIPPSDTDWVTPKMFGCLGNGVNDDTVGFQDFIDHICATGARGFIDATSTYVITQGIKYSGPFVLLGELRTKSVIKYTNPNGDLFSATDTCDYTRGLVIENLTIEGPGYNTVGNAIAFRGRTVKVNGRSANVNFSMSNVWFKNWYDNAMIISDSFNLRFTDIFAVSCGNISAGGDTVNKGFLQFTDIDFGDVSTTGNMFENIYVSNCNKGIYSTYDGANPGKHQVLGCIFIKCIFENNNWGFHAQRSRDIIFDNCYWEGNYFKGVKCGNARFRNCLQNKAHGFTTVNIGGVPTQVQDFDNKFQLGVDGFECSGTRIIESDAYTSITISDGPDTYVVRTDCHGEFINMTTGATEFRRYTMQQTFASGAIKLGPFGQTKIFVGSGSPEGVVSAGLASSYHNRSDDGLAKFWIKKYDNGVNGWVALDRNVTKFVECLAGGTTTLTTGFGLYQNVTQATIATHTVALPFGLEDGDNITFRTAGAITALTITHTGGTTPSIVNNITTLGAGKEFHALYKKAQNIFFITT